MNLFNVATTAQSGLAGWLPMILIWAGFIIIFYFLFIRPRKKQQEKVQSMRESLSPGKKITTIGGFVGVVESIEDNEAIIDSEGTKLRILKLAIAEIVEEEK